MQVLPSSANVNARLALVAKSLRSIADGFVSILLPAYLLELGLSPLQVGAISTATLLGSAALTILAGLVTSRFGHRRPLLAASALMVATGVAFASVQEFLPLLLIAFVGTLNPSSGDVSIFLPLEQSLLGESVGDRDRTVLFARYSVAGALMGSIGTLLAGVPEFAAPRLGASPVALMRDMFVLYALLGLAAGAIYRRIREPEPEQRSRVSQPLGPSRGLVYRLAALFSVDAFAGGFFVQSILALWLFNAFNLSVATTATLFFWMGLLTAASYLAAPSIALRIGLIRTMVFSHLLSSLCLIVIPFVRSLSGVIGLLMLRSLLSQMDVPARASYVIAVVTPPERAAAAGFTSVPRSLAAALSPTLAGYLLTLTSFGWPLLVGGALKIGYDLTLLALFRNIRPPEERISRLRRADPGP